MNKHKHYELIIAWANGAEIEYKDSFNMWNYHENPIWLINEEYRIKPEPKPDVVLYAYSKPYEKNGISLITNGYIRYENIFPLKEYSKPNIKLTYDGESKELKSAEVIWMMKI